MPFNETSYLSQIMTDGEIVKTLLLKVAFDVGVAFDVLNYASQHEYYFEDNPHL